MDEKPGNHKNLKRATFAGGCFWCMQPPFRKVEGVIDVVSGYAGGTKENPTYEKVSFSNTGHLESVQVT
jgi:peptide methionine sulfoxide reductase MsrA